MPYEFKHMTKGQTIGSGDYVFRHYSENAPTPQNCLVTSDDKIFLTSNGEYFIVQNS